MDAIVLMMEEHTNIKRVLSVIRKLCIRILNGEFVDYDDFYKIIDFVQNYADKHHHNKEEDILFKKMIADLGNEAAGGPLYGMLAEHDMGRLYIMNLINALELYKNGNSDSRVDIIANSISYADLLNRHIDKEDNAIYKFAQNKLSKDAVKEIEERCREAEVLAKEKNIQDKYLKLINELERL